MPKPSEKRDKLIEAVQLCNIHSERMRFAWGKVERHFPLDSEKYLKLQPEELSFLDQLIFRFAKLQDTMGGKLFSAILENLGEEVRELPFIDRLAKLEELNIIPSADEWLLLRETRNIVTHEYPAITGEVIQGLNLLAEHYHLIMDIWEQVKCFIKKRFGIEADS
mgnify:FL=1|jgi:uncharacterized protein with HEPN domain